MSTLEATEDVSSDSDSYMSLNGWLVAGSPGPLYQRLYAGIRGAIRDGQIVKGARLPSTRMLSQQLGVSRNTVMAAYEQLLAEGYLDAKAGAGTRVSTVLPAPAMSPTSKRVDRQQVALEASDETGGPALERFPVKLWVRLLTRRVKSSMSEMMSNAHPTGYRPLKEAIAAQLAIKRGFLCRPEQIFVLPGFDAAVRLINRALLRAGDRVWIEDPCSRLARAAFTNEGLTVTDVPVGREGFDVEVAQAIAPGARLACVTPERQFPLGIKMSPARRHALLGWARGEDGWILEDDRDGELNPAATPLSTLARADGMRRVLYLSSFDHLMFPALRISYLVVPDAEVAAFAQAWAESILHCPVLEQAVLADFIDAGYFALHLRRMRALYADRSKAMSDAMWREMDSSVTVLSTPGGLFATMLFSGAADHSVVADAFSRQETLHVRALSSFCTDSQWNGVVFGIGALEKPSLQRMVQRLTTSVHNLL